MHSGTPQSESRREQKLYVTTRMHEDQYSIYLIDPFSLTLTVGDLSRFVVILPGCLHALRFIY